MASSEPIQIHVELTFYQIVKTNKKWWQFWKDETTKIIMDFDRLEKLNEQT